ncbi:MAG: hypothetical protein Q7J54_00400 [Candidatus Woesearchaeota archaeon]|nr:hypothetical protein [Candidatus Woesearchaeota archaeon]
MKKRGQASTEYMIIIGFVALVLIPLIVIFYKQGASTKDQITTSEADQIAKKITDAADSVYYMGEPSKMTLKLYMPENVKEISFSGREIRFKVATANGMTDITSVAATNMMGSIDNSQGIKFIVVEARGDYVWVGT